MSGFVRGLGAIARGAAFLLGHRELWLWAALPVGLTVVVLGLVLWGALAVAGGLTESVTAGGWGVLGFLKGAVEILVPVLVGLAVVAVAFFTFTMIGTVIASPFLDVISARTEALVPPARAPEAGAFWAGAWRSVSDALRVVRLELLVLLLGVPLNLVPVAGGLLWCLLGAWLAAFDFLDFPLARHRVPWKERWAFLRRHASAALGFGLGVYGLLLVPLAQLAVLPVAAVGATLLYLDLKTTSLEPEP